MENTQIYYVYSSLSVWRNVYNELKQSGYSVRKISAVIGSNFGKQLYKNQGLSITNFKKLEVLMGRKINYRYMKTKGENTNVDYINCKDNTTDNPNLNLVYNEDLAELIGIILGDGNISDKTIIITQNYVDNPEYIKYIERLIYKVFNIRPKRYHRRKEGKSPKTIDLKIHRISIIRELNNMGIPSGDKKKNQVTVPKWIYEKQDHLIACVRGLIDTDGCIYFVNRDKRYYVEFKNESQRLLDFVEFFLVKFQIHFSRYYNVIIIRQVESVSRLINLVKPNKAIKLDLNSL
ncbi:MAG: hypothetical protein INQ03_15265 [Candidatus Heimdallarchaeota archaeon]|nr:hypothetical protein [Candidatus Heimdallarchaeota archaeon]